MTTNPPATETIALTEKKMDMSLDEIINMSKKKSIAKERRPQRMPIINRGFQKFGALVPQNQKGFNKARQFADSRSAMRQGALAQRRTYFNGKNNFPVTNKIAKKAGNIPFRTNKPVWNRPRAGPTYTQGSAYVQNGAASNSSFDHRKKPQTMDALFSRMQQERKKTNPKLTSGGYTSRQVAHIRQPPPPAQHYQRQGRRLATVYNAY
ncbi:hypothetical protein LUZ60_013645 [Juncus effusus]|nr:hypothetical protein LUZ60_013645 [Juncus effusus]